MAVSTEREERITVNQSKELRRCILSPILLRMARKGRGSGLALRLSQKWEGGGFYSWTARRIMEERYRVSVGAYSYGACFVPCAFPPGVTIGRYVSIAQGVEALLRNHPMDRLSTHPFFFNRRLGFLKEDNIPSGTLEIGHDAWIGQRTMITSGCRRIGIGAIVGAGAIVTRDVPDFAIAVGCPAKVVKYRYPEELRAEVLASRWWERSLDECIAEFSLFVKPIANGFSNHPLFKAQGQAGPGAGQP